MKKEPTQLDQAARQGAELMAKSKQQPQEDPYGSYRGYLQKLIDDGEKTDNDLRREERLARVHEAVAGISDAGRAVANFIGTTMGAPNAYTDSGLSDKARERVEKARAEREKNRAALLNYAYQESKLNENERSWKERLRNNRALLRVQRDKVKVQEEAARYKAEEAARKEQEAADIIFAENFAEEQYPDWIKFGENFNQDEYDKKITEYKNQLTPAQFNKVIAKFNKAIEKGQSIKRQNTKADKPRNNNNGSNPYEVGHIDW